MPSNPPSNHPATSAQDLINLARWLLKSGAGTSARRVLGDTLGRAANDLREEAKTASLRPGLYSLGIWLSGEGIVIPLRAEEGAQGPADEAFRLAVDMALKAAQLRVKRNLPGLRLSMDACLEPYGGSIGLAAALTFYAHYTHSYPKRAVFATGSLDADGYVGRAKGLAEKLAAADAEVVGVASNPGVDAIVIGPPLEPDQTTFSSIPYRTVRTLDEAIEAVFGVRLKRRKLFAAIGAAGVAAASVFMIRKQRPTAIKLRVGLSSEHPHQIERTLRVYESSVRARYARDGVKFDIKVTRHPYDAAPDAFVNERFDVLMLDDPWLAEFAPSLLRLDTNDHFQKQAQSYQPSDVFVPSVLDACRIDQKLLGLPLIGNVQMLVARNDMWGSTASNCLLDVAKIRMDPREMLSLAKCMRDVSRPIGIRGATPNDLVEIFWELLRAQGYEDVVSTRDGAVEIPRRDAVGAWKILSSLPGYDRMGADNPKTIVRQMWPEQEAQKPSMALAFGWPNWVFERVRGHDALSQTVQLFPLSKHPVMGIWLLAVRSDSPHPEAAIDFIWSLTSERALQIGLAANGVVPVLTQLSAENLRDEAPLVAQHFSQIRSALDAARPRARSQRWRRVEADLYSMIREGDFTDVEGVVRFVD